MRLYIEANKIPRFDPTQLPFWETYQKEGTAATIQAGGTLAGKFTAGLSGGQRRLLLFELICQRTRHINEICVFVSMNPFRVWPTILCPLFKIDYKRSVKSTNLATNYHVETLKAMADHILTVSAIDRSVGPNQRQIQRGL